MPYNILALDGGGSWAILQAQALGELYGYSTSGQSILSRFTLAAATSGGAIVLAGLALNYTPRDLINLLNAEKMRQTIFVNNYPEHLFGIELYKTTAKLEGLKTVMSKAPDGAKANQPLNQINPPCKLIFSTFDYDRQRELFFRSDANSPAALGAGPQPTLAEAVHASSTAPIKYFDAPAQLESPAFSGCRYWDGAMGGFNNPVMAAVTEALAYGFAPADLRVLSIGTGAVFLPLPSPMPEPNAPGQNSLCVQIQASGLWHDATDVLPTIILDDPPDQASFVAHLLVSGPKALSQNPASPVTNGNLIRLNPWIQPVKDSSGNWIPPSLIAHAPDSNMSPPNSVPVNYPGDAGVFDALVNLGLDAVEQSEIDLITTLGRSWIAGDTPNQAIRATPDMKPLIGHGTFAAAVAQARAIGL